MGGTSLKAWIYHDIFETVASPQNASLQLRSRYSLFAILVAWVMYRKQILAKLLRTLSTFFHHEDHIPCAQAWFDGPGSGAQPIARRGDDGVTVGVSAHGHGSQHPDAFSILEEVAHLAFPRAAFGRYARLKPLFGCGQLERVVGAVEVGDLIRNLEQMALGGKEGHSHSPVSTLWCLETERLLQNELGRRIDEELAQHDD